MASACALETPQDQELQATPQAIVKGEEPARGTYPNLVQIFRTRLGFCAGTLIHPEWVLTSAECVELAPGSWLLVGGHLLGEGESRNPRRVFQHPSYRAASGKPADYNIGLIQLDKPSTVPPVRLASASELASLPTDTLTTVAGWGETDVPLQPLSPVLQHLRGLKLMAQATCEATYTGVTPRMLCTVPKFGHGACDGDFGDPLFAEIGGVRMQIGTLSYIASKGPCGWVEAIYTRPSEFREWIDATIAADHCGIECSNEFVSCQAMNPDEFCFCTTGYASCLAECGRSVDVPPLCTGKKPPRFPR